MLVFKYVVLGLLLYSDAFSMEFDKIVRNNAQNPTKLIEELKSIRDKSVEAEAFIQKFGGDNFQKCNGDETIYSNQINEKVAEAAFVVGSEMRRIGASQIDNIEALEISKRFLEIANSSVNYNLVDQDISSSLWSDQLTDMILNRRAYQNSILVLKENLNKKRSEKTSFVDLPEDLLNEL